MTAKQDLQTYQIVRLPSCSSDSKEKDSLKLLDTTDLCDGPETPIEECSPCDGEPQDLLTAVPKDHTRNQQLPPLVSGLKVNRLSESTSRDE